MKIAIVSGCDANYYPLLRELMASIRQFPQSASVDICVLDAGLLPEQVDELKTTAAATVAPDWPVGIPAEKCRGQDYLKACICRPFIPRIFPGYDMYLWLDADTWVQQWAAIEMYIAAASKGDRIAVTNGADRAYEKPVRIKWLGYWPMRIKNFYASNGVMAFGRGFAKAMAARYVYSAGCFALAAQAPHWRRWQELVVQAAKKGKLFPAEQLSLGKLLHLDGFRAEILPAYTHWLCVRKPAWDAQKKMFVEPYLPHEPLGVLHLSGVDPLRADRAATADVPTTDGAQVALNYRYPGFDGGRLGQAAPNR